MKDFAKKIMNMDPELGLVAFAFVIACMIWASPLFFLRDNVLGKIIMIAAIIALTMYHRIAGIIAVIAIIAVLNQLTITPMKEGMVNPFASASGATPTTPAPSGSFTTPDEFRKKFCVKGAADDPMQTGKLAFSYMLSPAFFSKLDASGNPIIDQDVIAAFGSLDPKSFFKCTPLTMKSGGQAYETINNMCDPACSWTMNPTPSAAAASPPAEGFTPMLRPHIRTGRHLVTNGLNNLKSGANRLKRQLF
jgi:hypothetical protein